MIRFYKRDNKRPGYVELVTAADLSYFNGKEVSPPRGASYTISEEEPYYILEIRLGMIHILRGLWKSLTLRNYKIVIGHNYDSKAALYNLTSDETEQ